MKEYNHKKIEKKWQDIWEKKKIYSVSDKTKKPKFYSLIEFPYPSGDGLHVGHPRSYVGMDIISRKRCMEGYNVLYPIGWDAFGLPTENYAIKTGIRPQIIVKKNISTFRRQIKSLGISFDWSREINTTDPAYYKWTQWIFLQFFKNGLAYKAESEINWCPKDKIGLANEEVVDGKCERCGTPTEKRMKKQWMLRITKYADRLDKDLDLVDYPERVKISQRNWIGKKEGINITYHIDDLKEMITVFTTRPDTNYGATFIVLAPENSLIGKITLEGEQKTVQEYIKKSKSKSEEERISEGHKKTGVFTGRYAVNHLTGKKMPIWISDFVIGSFGTGAVVGVPGHDIRDFEFAKEFGLEIVRVVIGKDGDTSPITKTEQVQEENGTMINSGILNGIEIHKATEKIMNYMVEKGWGEKITTYHIRDWIFSRQRYWGEPIPIVDCPNCGIVPVPEKDLPLKLPEVKSYKLTETGESPLAAISKWVNVKCPKCGGKAKRETDTMPNWAGSSWYYLRYADPKNKKKFADPKKLKYWQPVDWYNGGMEHTTLHLLYSRFWHKFLYDLKLVPTVEPYKKRTSHGMILGEGGVKMSKSLGNVVNPDEIIKLYGADTLRVYEMFIGPFEDMAVWNTESIIGSRRFIEKVWRIGQKTSENLKNFSGPRVAHAVNFKKNGLNQTIQNPLGPLALQKLLHKTIKKVSEDIESMRFNTAISAMMILATEMEKAQGQSLREFPQGLSLEDFKKFLQILAPFAPHVAEELWSLLGKKELIVFSAWPKWDENLIKDEEIKIAVQINGKVRGEILVGADENGESVKKKAVADEKISKFIAGREVKKIIYVKGRIVNIVI